jgi:hypothetical protein
MFKWIDGLRKLVSPPGFSDVYESAKRLVWEDAPEPDLSRRAFLKGFGASMAAAMIAPSLPPIAEALPELAADIQHAMTAQYSIIEQVYQNALEEIMAAEDARVMALLDRVIESSQAVSHFQTAPVVSG